MLLPKKISPWITKRDRDILIEWFVDSMLDHDEDPDEVSEMEEYLRSLNNYLLLEMCIDFMPSCMEDLQQVHDDYNSYTHDLELYRAK